MIFLIWTVNCFGQGQVHTTELLNFSALSNDTLSWDLYITIVYMLYNTCLVCKSFWRTFLFPFEN